MNIYRHTFALQCPANDEQIIYQLVIESATMIMAEDIVKEVQRNREEFHEALAERLYAIFGGRQVITATHHGVDIETRRGSE
jgi:hypothetical protein